MPNVVARLEILLNDNGQVQVNGPIADRVLCYGLLEVAKDSVQAYTIEQQRQVQPTTVAEAIALLGAK